MQKINLRYWLLMIGLLIYGTGCSVLKNSQNASHPLVNEVERNSNFIATTKHKKSKNSKKIVLNSVIAENKINNFEENQIEIKSENKKFLHNTELTKEASLTKNTTESEGIVKNLVLEAQKYLGTAYKVGGTSKSGVDCSGLVMVVYQTQGIQLPRISSEQYKFGKPLQIHEIQPGDLLFFSTPSRPNEIGHSAMCVAIEDKKIKFIHAASNGVRYDYLVPGYYLTHYKGACRVLGSNLSLSNK